MKPAQNLPVEHNTTTATPTLPHTASELPRAGGLKHIARAVLELGVPHEPLFPITKPLQRQVTQTFTGTYPNLRPVYMQLLETIQEEDPAPLPRSEPEFR